MSFLLYILLKLFEEAVRRPRVTRRPCLLYYGKQRIAVAIDADLVDPLGVARFLALAPLAGARAREVRGQARAPRLLERRAVGPGKHEHATVVDILDAHRDQAALVEAHRVEPAGGIGVRTGIGGGIRGGGAHASLMGMPCSAR